MNAKTALARLFLAVGTVLVITGVLPHTALLASPASAADQPGQPDLLEGYGQLPLSFEPNQGQTDGQVDFISRGSGYSLFLTPTRAVLAVRRPAAPSGDPGDPPVIEQAVLHMELVGANAAPLVTALEELPGRANYFVGGDSQTWQTNVPTYGKVKYEAVYPGVDLIYYGNQQELEYDFVLAPGADPAVITLGFEGVDVLEVDAAGDLVLHIGSEQVRMRKPLIYQEVDGVRQEISGGYIFTGVNEVGFDVGAYDTALPLVIDPSLVYSVNIGGSGLDLGNGIAVDSAGNAYITGRTSSTNFPATPGGFQTTFGGSFGDAFVVKLNPTGGVVYATYLGGSGFDEGLSLAVDAAGYVYVTGDTRSTNFPTASPFQPTHGGGANSDDAFVAKLNATGTALLFSSFLGGQCDDRGFGLAIDSANNVYLTGETGNCFSNNFPTVNAFQSTFGGSTGGASFDVFMTKLSAAGSTLIYSTFVGGTTYDVGRGIAVDSAGNAYITGMTQSTNFPTQNPFQSTRNGLALDAFVSKIDPSQVGAGSLVYSTYLGGSGEEDGFGITVDSAGNAYVAGLTASSNFPTASPLQSAFGGGSGDVFITKFNAAGSALVYSTYLGGAGFDRGLGITVDSAGNAHITGQAGSGFPTVSAFQTCCSGFVSKLNTTGSALTYSSYLTSIGNSIALDASGNAYVTGFTGSDAFAAKISPLPCTLVTNLNDSGPGSLRTAITCANSNPGPDTVTFAVAGTITILTQLPDISDASGGTLIDGTTAPGYAGAPVVILNGPSASGFVRGLRITSANNEARALQIRSFAMGIEIVGSSASGNMVTGSYIGTDGNVAIPNGTGIYIDSAPSTRIGTNGDEANDAAERNVISGNNGTGIFVYNTSASGTVVAGNYIGTNAAGTAAIANLGQAGVQIIISSNNRIGTDGNGVGDAAERNIINGNKGSGIHLSSSANGNVIAGNYIGLDATGTAPIGNGVVNGATRDGIAIFNSSNNRIGTNGDGVADEAERNVISANSNHGVTISNSTSNGNVIAGNYVGTDATGTLDIGNTFIGIAVTGGTNNRVGTDGNGIADAAERNVSSGNGSYGILVQNSSTINTIVAGNFVGTDATGTAALGNTQGGVRVEAAPNTRLGTDGNGLADMAERNLISGNSVNGVEIYNVTNAVVAGNYIGTDVTGLLDLGNGHMGMQVFGGRVGTNGDGVSDAAERNVISGNAQDGILIFGSNTIVAGNYIGTDKMGTAALGNSQNGIQIQGSPSNIRIGTDGNGVADEAERNIISSNGASGILGYGIIAGNYIGTDVTGMLDLGNGRWGIIGGGRIGTNGDGVNDAAERNLVSGNSWDGVLVGSNTTVAGNFIGTDATGMGALGNSGHGVSVSSGSNTIVGGTASSAANVIAFNGDDGVFISSGTGTARRNAIFSNTGLGIDLGANGVTANDTGDGDTGANNLQNFPVLTFADSDATSTVIQGTLNSAANTTFTLEFFSNTACDPSGFGEGQTFLGSTPVTTSGSGNVSFMATFPTVVPQGQFITATATDPGGNTSEFSACRIVGPSNQPPTANADGPYSVSEGGSVTLNGLGNDPDGDPLTYAWDLDNNGTFETPGQNVAFSAAGRDGPGSQGVVLQVCDDDSACATSSTTVNITNVAPTITSVADSGPISEGSSAMITVSASDPAGANDPLSYAFDCDNNGSYEVGPQASNSTSCSFADNGAFVVNVRVTDGDGGLTTASTTVAVNNIAPTATFTASSPINEGTSSTLSLTAASDPGSADTAAGFRYSFACDGQDGSLATSYAAAGVSSTTTCAFGDNGSNTVKARVLDKDNGYTTYQATVVVNNIAPTITDVTNTGPIAEGGSATVTVTASDPAGSNDPLSYEFDCNDNGVYEVGPQADNTASCAFSNDGTFVVNVRVTDGDSEQDTGSATITVNNVAPTITTVTNSGPIAEGGGASVTVTATDPAGVNDPLSYEFDCNGSSVYEVGPQASNTASCVFDDNGSFTVNVRVTDGDGGVTNASTEVVVNNVAPTAALAATSPINEGGSSGLSLTGALDSSTADTTAGFRYSFACDGQDSSLATSHAMAGTSSAVTCAFTDDDTYIVKGRIFDKDDDFSTYQATVVVNNIAPTITAVVNSGPIAEGGSANVTVTATDPAGANDPLSYAFDCDNDDVYNVGPQASNMASCAFGDDGPFTVNVRVTDDDGGADSDVTTVVVTNVAPTILSVTNDGPIAEGGNASVTVTAADPAGANDPLSYEFDCDNDNLYDVGPQAGDTATCAFEDNGIFTVNVRVTDGDGGEDTDFTTVAVNNVAPTISAITNDGPIAEGGSANVTVTATDPAGANDPLSYEFDCDNNNVYEAGPQAGNTASCTFSDDGTFTVNVRVTDGDGGADSNATAVVVTNVAPTAIFVADSPTNEGSSSLLSLTGALDPSTTDTMAGFRYAFACDGQDSSLVTTYAAAGASSTTTCTFGDNGSYTVKGRIFDKDSDYTTYQAAVVVSNVAPTATFTAISPISEGDSSSLSLTGGTDPGPADTAAGFRYSFACDGQDGLLATSYAAAGTSSIATCAYGDNGSYSVKGRIFDKDSDYITYQTTVVVNNVAPTITVVMNTGPIAEGGSASVTVTATDPAGVNDPLGYEFDCENDGVYEVGPQASNAASCSFTDNGSFTVNVRVADDDGGADSDSTSVLVTNVAPTILSVTNDGPIAEGGNASITVTATDPAGVNDPLSYEFDCDDDSLYEAGPQAGNTASCAFGDDGSFTVNVRVTDGDGGEATGSTTVIVTNVAPTVMLSGPASANEGETKHYTFSTSDPGDDTFSLVSQSCGANGTLSNAAFDSTTGAGSFDCTFPDGPASSTVSVQVRDSDEANSTPDSIAVAIANVAPDVTLSGDSSANEGETKTYAYTVFDPGADELTLSESCGASGIYVDTPAVNSFDCAFPDGPENTVVTVTADDGDPSDNLGSDSTTVVIANVNPAAALAATSPIDEGSSSSLSLTGETDPSAADMAAGFRYSFACDGQDSSLATTYAAAGASNAATCAFGDNGSYIVKARIFDEDEGFATYEAAVVVNNVAPTVGAITAPIAPVLVNTNINASASFTDPGLLDTHTAVWDWDDGATSAGTVVETGGSGTVADSHTYTTPGVYVVKLTVTDDDGGSGESVFQYVVVYDPEGGFVTGGGWINSPIGAYTPDPTLTGKANFGFVSKYQKGANIPTGQTEFQFKVANLNFHSTDYQWLVVAGAKAQYKGSGTINGGGDYGFMITAIDGQVNGGGGADKFRIKIWDKATGNLIYDNQVGASDADDPTTVIGGGSIVIHK